jgi:phage-related protein
MARLAAPLRPQIWLASSKRDYGEFPGRVQANFGFGLYLAQTGQHPPSAKPLKGFGGVIELVEDFQGDTYRAVYTVRFRVATTFCTRSRKSRSAASGRRSRIWNASG